MARYTHTHTHRHTHTLCSVTSVVSYSVCPYELQLVRFLCPWDSPGKNTRVRCHALLQGILLTQGSNSCL